MRGLTLSVIALIVPPLPAPSRPSKMMQTLRPLCTTHCWSLTSSTCRRASSRSYFFCFSLPLGSVTSVLVLDIESLMASILRSALGGLAGVVRQLYQNATALAGFLLLRSTVGARLERSWSSAGRTCCEGLRPQRRLLPSQKEADVTGHPARILEHLGLEVEAERSQVIVPKFIRRLGSTLQSRLPVGLRVVDPAAAVAAQLVGEAVDLDFGLSGLGGMIDQPHHYLHQLLGRALRRFVKFRHHGLLLFLLLAHAAQFLGGLGRFALCHATLEISDRKSPGPHAGRLRRAVIG